MFKFISASESTTAEVAAEAGTTVLQNSGGCTNHALIAQMANFGKTVAPKETEYHKFCSDLIEAIKAHKAGKGVKLDAALANFIKGKDPMSTKIVSLIVAITAPNVTWKDMQVASTKVLASHMEYTKNAIHEFFRNNKVGVINDMYKFLQSTFSDCPK